MSQFITPSKHFHGQAYRKKSELRIGGLGKFEGRSFFFSFFLNIKKGEVSALLVHNHNSH